MVNRGKFELPLNRSGKIIPWNLLNLRDIDEKWGRKDWNDWRLKKRLKFSQRWRFLEWVQRMRKKPVPKVARFYGRLNFSRIHCSPFLLQLHTLFLTFHLITSSTSGGRAVVSSGKWQIEGSRFNFSSPSVPSFLRRANSFYRAISNRRSGIDGKITVRTGHFQLRDIMGDYSHPNWVIP